MEIQEAKSRFLEAWGTLGSSWGVSRTMAQIHALLLISPEALSAEDVMEQLNISRGNANMNLRALIDWGLVRKELKPGERREFFVAEKQMWKIARQIVKERRKRELEPMMNVLDDLKKVEGDPKNKEVQAFTETVNNIHAFATKADKTLGTIMKADENWFLGPFMRLMS